MRNFAIGAFDSGLGGLTVVKELRKALPNENIVYFGDTGRVPYGSKSEITITKYAKEDEAFLIKNNVKLIVAACGTVSSLTVDKPNTLSVPFFEMITPAVKSAVKATKNKRIGIIGTYATIKSEAHKNKIKELMPEAFVLGEACPLFVPMVENGIIDKNDIVVKEMVKRYLKPIKEAECDTLIMGCTHYPILESAFNEYLEGKVTLINPGEMLAKTVKEYLTENNLLNDSGCKKGLENECKIGLENYGNNKNSERSNELKQGIEKTGRIEYFVSDKPDSFMKQALILLGEEASGDITKIDIEKEK